MTACHCVDRDVCRSCATKAGINRLCDARAPAAPAPGDAHLDVHGDIAQDEARVAVDAVMARIEQIDNEVKAYIATVLSEIGPLNPDDVVLVPFEGEEFVLEAVEDFIDALREQNPSRRRLPFVVVPNGFLHVTRSAARAAGLELIALSLVEAPPVQFFEVESGAAALAFERWFLRQDLSDDEIVEILAEQGATGDEVHETLAERAHRRGNPEREPEPYSGKETS